MKRGIILATVFTLAGGGLIASGCTGKEAGNCLVDCLTGTCEFLLKCNYAICSNIDGEEIKNDLIGCTGQDQAGFSCSTFKHLKTNDYTVNALEITEVIEQSDYNLICITYDILANEEFSDALRIDATIAVKYNGEELLTIRVWSANYSVVTIKGTSNPRIDVLPSKNVADYTIEIKQIVANY